MTRRGSALPETGRLGVPDLFREGRFEQVLIVTFGADLEFYERVLRRHFGAFRNQIVLADGPQLDQSIAGLAGSNGLRHLNRSWLAGPVRTRHAAHAKLVLLAGPEAGLLLVGSGNLNISGYAGAGECFTPYRWNPEDDRDLPAFTTARALTDGLAAREHLDDVTVDRLGVFWSAYDWWHQPPIADGPVRLNLEVPLGVQLVEAVGGDIVEELTVAAPFHDPRCAALDRLAGELTPKRMRILVQPGQCSVDPDRLAVVVKNRSGDVYSLTAAGDHSGAYLHAKSIVAVTKTRAVCLTGSANCSMVALWRPQPDANIELGNLTIGAPDAFDHLFAPTNISIVGPVDPASLDLRIHDDVSDEDEDLDPTLRLVDFRWNTPRLTAKISPPVTDPARVTVEIDGHDAAAVVSVAPAEPDWSMLGIELTDPADIDAIDRVAVVTIRVGESGLTAAVPYQLERLREQDRRRVDADRLRHAARLDLEDPDLEQALAALEEILVGDNVARWTHDRQTSAKGTTTEGESIAWEDIDWGAVRRHPRFAAYGGLAGLGAPGSDLAAYLDALSQIVRELMEPDPTTASASTPPSTPPDPDDDEDETDVSGGVEGAEVDEEPGDEPIHRQSPAARNRRLIRNFVRRNLDALQQPAFREGAGPGIVIPNAIILNWVCWWVATKDENHDITELIDERLRLWQLLWGDISGEGGYLDELEDEHKQLVLDRFDDQSFEPVTVASMVDVWASLSESDPQYRRLRRILRRAVTHPCWQANASHLAGAARLTNGRPTTLEATDPLGLAEALWDTACEPIGDTDVKTALASVAGVSPNAVTMTRVDVSIDGTNAKQSVRQAFVEASLPSEQVTLVLASWLGFDELPFYRLKWEDGVCFYNGSKKTGSIFRSDGSELNLTRVTPARPPWRVELDRLYEGAEQLVESAA